MSRPWDESPIQSLSHCHADLGLGLAVLKLGAFGGDYFLFRGTGEREGWAVSMFDKFHLTFNVKSKVSRDVLKNKNEC